MRLTKSYKLRNNTNLLLSAFLALVLIFTNCGKKAVKINPDYVGSWATCYVNICYRSTLDIDEKSHGEYWNSNCCTSSDCYTDAKGIVKIKKGRMKIGLIRSFTIFQEPIQHDTVVCDIDGNKYYWTMKLDSQTYYK